MGRSFLVPLVLLFAAAGSAACREQQQEQPASEPPLPAFQESGPTAFRVSGVDVPVATVERFLRIWKQRHPAMSEKTQLRYAIEEGIIPQAAVYAAYRSEVPELTRRARKIHERLKAGEGWKDVVADVSEDPFSRTADGNVGLWGRKAVPGLTPLAPLVEDIAFSMPVGDFSQPFVTEKGIQIVRASSEKPGSEPGQEQRQIERILLSFNKDYAAFLRSLDIKKLQAEQEKIQAEVEREKAAGRVPEEKVLPEVQELNAYKETLKDLIRGARVEVVDEQYRPVIYGYRLAAEDGPGGGDEKAAKDGGR